MEILLDGTGNGHQAEVDADKKLATTAVTRSTIAFVSENSGDAFRVVSDFLDLTTTRGCMFWFKNDSSSKHFHVQQFNVSWNGGNTNFNRPIEAELRGGTSEPSANTTALAVRGLNSTKPKTGSFTAYEWDGVGTGMTVASEGALTGTAIFPPGLTVVSPDGAIIIGTNGTLGVFVKAAEVGRFTITLEGYYEDNES